MSIYVPGAVAFEQTHEHADREFAMRSRVGVRSINALVQRAPLPNPLRDFFSTALPFLSPCNWAIPPPQRAEMTLIERSKFQERPLPLF